VIGIILSNLKIKSGLAFHTADQVAFDFRWFTALVRFTWSFKGRYVYALFAAGMAGNEKETTKYA
jgi:hypothetical protein